MKASRLPVVSFALAVVLSASTAAMAAWYRVDTGLGNGSYGGGGQGCLIASSGNYGGTKIWSCPIADNSGISGYTPSFAYFTNSNVTQPVGACVAFWNSTGGSCSWTGTNNCPSRGVCTVAMNISVWNSYRDHFKFAMFDNLSAGVLLSGYTLYTNP